MSDMEILDRLIRTDARIRTRQEHDKTLAELKEPQTSDSSVTIRSLPPDALIIKTDCFPSPDAIFKGNKGECKRSDYVVISEQNKCILYIEVKRTSDSWTEVTQQLAGASCFIAYCRTVVEAFWGERDFLSSYKERFVCFRHTRTDQKRRTREERNSDVHDTPLKAKKIDWPRTTGVYFYKLLGYME